MLEYRVMENFMPYMNLIVPGFIALAAIVVVGSLGAVHRKNMRPWVKLASTFGSSDVYSGIFSRGFSARYQGQEFSVKTIERRQSRRLSPKRPYLEITLKKETSLRLTVRRQSGGILDGCLETLGIMKDIRTGDPVFDQEFALSSADHAGVTNLFLVPETKGAVRDILSMGFDAVILNGKTVVAYMDQFYIAELDMEHARVSSVLDGLLLISSRAG